MTIDLSTSLSASARGWGDGWNHCQSDKIESFVFNGRNGDIAFPGGLHVDIVDLVTALLTETEERGYLLRPGWCWGYGCRAIKGVLPAVSSNHAWGIALDINAPMNALGSSSTDMPSWMPNLWNEFGFRWGGDYTGRPDPMHYEFLGTPADARAMTDRAKEVLVSLNKTQQEQLVWLEGFQSYMRGEKEPPKVGPKKRGWNDAQIAVEGKVPAH